MRQPFTADDLDRSDREIRERALRQFEEHRHEQAAVFLGQWKRDDELPTRGDVSFAVGRKTTSSDTGDRRRLSLVSLSKSVAIGVRRGRRCGNALLEGASYLER